MDRELLQNRRFTFALVAAAIIAVVYLAINVFKIGGDTAVFSINNYVEPVFAIINGCVCFWLWRQAKNEDVIRKVWGYFALGIGLWCIAEVLWVIFSLGIIQEPPYPSVADIFYFAGYFPLFISLVIRFRTLQAPPTAKQWRTIILISIPAIAVTIYFILRPIFSDFSSERFIEAFLNVFYPLADLALLMAASFILSVISGKFSLAWRVITIGLILTAFGDLMFAYADWNGLYYPDGHLNLVTILVDYPYNIAYLVMAFGAYVYWLTNKSKSKKEEALPGVITAAREANCDILLFTDRENKIISFSKNLTRLVKVLDERRLAGIPIQQILGLESLDIAPIFSEIVDTGFINDREFYIFDQQGLTHKIWMTALAVRGTEGEYEGANIVLQAFVEDKIENDLSAESQMMVKHMLTKAGVVERENRQIVNRYFTLRIEVLYNLVKNLGGNVPASAMVALLNQTAKQNGWPIEFKLPEIHLPEGFENKIDAGAYLALIKTAQSYASNVTSSADVENEIEKADRQMSPIDLKIVDSFGLRA